MHEKVTTDLNFVDRENAVSEFWKKNGIFKKSMEQRQKAGAPTYTFYDGPPTANGKPHIGHVLTRVIKDMIPRYRAMKGYYVPRKAGWDTHGLPVELEVEKKLGIEGKDQIEKYGLEPFIQECKKSVWQYKGMWEDFSEKVGFWADMENPYVTYEDEYIESEWWALKQIWDKKLLYKGFKVVPYCPRCGTPLSSHEVAQGYKAVKERSAVARFKVRDEEAYILAWTTTPWTLPSNVALCVNPDESYIKVKAIDGFTYILAEALADKVLGALKKDKDESEEKPYEVISRCKGTELEHLSYVPLFDCTGKEAERQKKEAHFVVCDTYVTMDDGTGIVHIAPAFGEDDARVGRKYDLPLIQFVDEKGLMKEETPFAGLFIKDADPEVLKDLDKRKLLFSAPKFEHDYPFCWRCDTPLIYYARESWFIKMTEMRDNLLKNNDQINWIPPTIGTGRFGEWLKNIQDWAISRNRYWGTPLNIWECAECGHRESIGSRDELYKLSQNEKAKTVELHRPFIDEITCKCPKCGADMKRVPEVIDCWFDSGAMPFAQHHYPFENQETFKAQYPAAFISEAVDQTRGWFYSLLAESTLLFDSPCYENVIVMGLVLDADGNKMSKSKGNAVDPFDALNRFGADAIRWYFYSNSAPWLPNRFHDLAVMEGQRKFMGTLWNTYAFYVLYANIDEFDATKHKLDMDSLPIMDRWVLSRLNTCIKETDEALDKYKITEAAKLLEAFVDELSNWYVRLCRKRYWAKGMEQDKVNAYMTLYTCLTEISKAAAPMIPFMAEQIYQNLVINLDKSAKEAIHLCDYPVASEEFIDKKLEEDMGFIQTIVALGRSARNACNIKNRQPLSRMIVQSTGEISDFYQNIIKDELNVKAVELASSMGGLTSYIIKPNFKAVGAKYGKLTNKIKAELEKIDATAAVESLKANGEFILTVEGQGIALKNEDVDISEKSREGFVTEGDGKVSVALDTVLTDELLEEGMVREIISKLQTMMREAGFEVMDKIRISSSGNEKIAGILERNSAFVKKEAMADQIVSNITDNDKGFIKDWNMNGENVTLQVEKL
ncbi:MAG: isoleucine--tRNA ligase [Lachnospiraceae bacterium]|nr:isoleucine--tRNA ligase [Lachnospiraceae bacterium]